MNVTPPLDAEGKVVKTRALVLSRARSYLSAAASRIDSVVSRIGHAGKSWLLWPVFYAIATGSAGWMLAHTPRLKDIDVNKVGLSDSVQMLLWVAGALGALSVVYIAAVVWVRRRAGGFRMVEVFGALNRRLRPLLALPVLPGFFIRGIEKDSPKLTFLYIGLAAAAVGWGVYGWIRPSSPEPVTPEAPESVRPSRLRHILGKLTAGLAVALLWAAYGVFFSRLSIINHRALNTRTIDLGYYDNIFYQSIHGRPLGCSLIRGGWHGSAHFDPLLVVLSPLYLLYPRAELILALQAVWLGAGVVPVYLMARDKLGRSGPGIFLSAIYVLYPALHGANMYEFHSLTLLSPIILWLLYFLERGSSAGYYLTLIPALLLREDVPLLLCFVGLYAIVSNRAGDARKGWVTIVVSLIYFVVVKRYFMTSSEIFMVGKDSLSFAYYYEDLIPNKNGALGLVVSVFTNPWFLVKHIFTEAKVQYFLTLFVPLAFLPFFARTARIMLWYGLLFCFLATRTAVFSPAFQYSSVILPIAFAITPIALRQIEDGQALVLQGVDGRRLWGALLGAAFVASLLCSWKFGGVLENQVFRGGFTGVTRVLTPEQRQTYAWLRAQIAQIPPGAVVGVTNRTGCHVSNRKDVYFYPNSHPPSTEWFLLDEAELRGADLERHTKQVQQGRLQEISRHGKLALFRRKR